MNKKTDLRVIRTKKMTFEAFITLMEEKSFESISVQEIAEQAMINRATFYAHFKNKEDLFEQLLHYVMESLTVILEDSDLLENNQVNIGKIEHTVTKIFKIIRDQKKFFFILLEGAPNEHFRHSLKNLLEEKYEKIFKKLKITEDEHEVPIDFIIEYMCAIFLTITHWWISTENDYPPDHMARLLIKLVGNGHLTVLGIEVTH